MNVSIWLSVSLSAELVLFRFEQAVSIHLRRKFLIQFTVKLLLGIIGKWKIGSKIDSWIELWTLEEQMNKMRLKKCERNSHFNAEEVSQPFKKIAKITIEKTSRTSFPNNSFWRDIKNTPGTFFAARFVEKSEKEDECEIVVYGKQKWHLAAKVHRERLAKALTFWATTLTRCLCNAREHIAKSGESRRRTTIR